MRDDMVIAPDLLDWYDTHARVLPWRVPPGSDIAPDPYRIWLSEIMLQQTTVAAVRDYFLRFICLWPTVQHLAAAEDAVVMAEWAGLGYYARARNLLACARAVAAMGSFPTTRAGLQALPGIGPYTAAAIAAIAFDRPEVVVDGNVERVVARLFAVRAPMPQAKRQLVGLAGTLTPQLRPGDYAQAMMDLGTTICTPRSPACILCPVAAPCRARAQGLAADLPARTPRPPKPERAGVAWVGLRDGQVLVERRGARGLLGGTLAFPSTGWDGSADPPPAEAAWRDAGTLRHVFTHFALTMTVRVGTIAADAAPARGEWRDLRQFDPTRMPGLMRKVWELARADMAA